MIPRTLPVLLLLLCLPAVAAGTATTSRELQGIKKEIKKKELLLKTTKKIEKQVSGELAVIEKSLREKQATLRRFTAELNALERGLAVTRGEARTVRQEVDHKQQEIRLRLVSLYKTGDIGPVRIFFSSDSIPQSLEGLRYMQAVLQADRRLIDDYRSRIEELQRLEVKIAEDVRKKETLRADIESKKNEIEAERKRKAEYLAKVRKDRDTYAASLKELEANAARLQAMMQKLEAKSRKRYSDKPAPQQADKEGPKSRAVPAFTTGFGSRKGQLSLPVRGEIIQRFGRHKHPEFNSYTVSNGLAIAAPAGTDIHAIDSGTVIFANYFKGYGNMIILDHGDGFFSVYAHASRFARKEGGSVARNEVIASVGDLDSSRGPMVYFEIRYQGKPVDPAPWFK
jgi:murein hydrolase activator